MADWDSPDFALAPLAAEEEEEEAYAAPQPTVEQPHNDAAAADFILSDSDETFPCIVVNLFPLQAEHPRASIADVRQATLETLDGDWTDRTSELMAAGVAWHVPRRDSAKHRDEHEAAHPTAKLSIFEYPSEIGGVRTTELWRAVTRPTPWEVVDELKRHLAQSRRPLKWQADVAVEIEQLADEEEEKRDLRAEAKDNPMLSALLAARNGVEAEEEYDDEEEDAHGRPTPSLVDVLLDMIFQHYPSAPPLPDGVGWTERAVAISSTKRTLRRMWKSFFGRLPAASEMVLKHAPKTILARDDTKGGSSSGGGGGARARGGAADEVNPFALPSRETTPAKKPQGGTAIVGAKGRPRMLVPGPLPPMPPREHAERAAKKELNFFDAADLDEMAAAFRQARFKDHAPPAPAYAVSEQTPRTETRPPTDLGNRSTLQDLFG